MTTDTLTADTTTTAAAPRSLTVGGRTFTLPFADLMPSQSADERARLLADIRAHSVRVPVVVTEDDELLDGHHRLAIAAELGLTDIPVTVTAGLTAAQKREYAESVNLHRRHLSREQVGAIIARHLTADPEQSDRSLAAKAGVDHKTVGRARKKLVATGELPQSATTRGTDGRTRPVKARPPAKASGGTPAAAEAGNAAGKGGKTGAPAKRSAGAAQQTTKRRRKPADLEPDDIASQSWPTALHDIALEVYCLLAPLRRATRLSAAKRVGDALRPLIARANRIAADLTTVADTQDARNRERANT